jgi:hypothetical protein
VTADDQVYEEDFKVRFDTYQQVIHYTYDFNEVKAFETAYIKGFKLIDGDEKHIFVKIYPPLNEYAPSTSFYKVLFNGEYKVYELTYETLKINNWMGPGSDGRSTASFVKHQYTYVRDKENFYKKIKYSKNFLRKVFRDDIETFNKYIKENGNINNDQELISFLTTLENS